MTETSSPSAIMEEAGTQEPSGGATRVTTISPPGTAGEAVRTPAPQARIRRRVVQQDEVADDVVRVPWPLPMGLKKSMEPDSDEEWEVIPEEYSPE